MKTYLRNILFLTSLIFSSVFSQLQDKPDVQISTSNTPHVENSIAISPTNSQNILISATGQINGSITQVPHYYTTNGGTSWSGSDITPNNAPSLGNSVAFFDYYGNAYLGFLGSGQTAIYIMKSINGGGTWGNVVATSSINDNTYDKPHAQADISGAYPNNIYVVWARVDYGSGPRNIEIGVSTNGGQSFGSTQELESNGNSEWVNGSNISIGPNGEVYVFWDQDEDIMRFSKSINGGQSFSTTQSIFTFIGYETGNDPLPFLNNTYTHSFPSSGVDRSNGPLRGNLYVVFSALDNTNGGDANVYLQKSTNGGSTWLSSAVQVNDEPSGTKRPQWFPSLSVDPVSGYLFVSYFSMINSNSNDFTTARYMAVSTDGGNSWFRIRVSDQTFIPTGLGSGYQPGYMGDYYETAAYGYEGYACWSDNHTNGTFQTYISKVDVSTQVTVDQFLQDGITRVGKLKRVQGSSFGPPLTPPQTFTFTGGTPEILLGDQSLISNQKYYTWSTPLNRIPDVTNHHKFDVILNNKLISNFYSTNNATIQAQLLEGGNPGGSVNFMDPWLIDYTDSYGTRNQGMSAPFKTVNYAANNLGTSTSYKGVLLGQDPQAIPIYYSVRAPQTHPNINGFIGYFQGWNTTNATLQQVGTNPSGYDQKAVVFNSANATVTAQYKAHLGTGNPLLADTKNQRRTAWGVDATVTGQKCWLTVYESMGNIWMTMYRDNGTVAVPEVRLNNYSGMASNPTVAYASQWPAPWNYCAHAIIGWVENNGTTREFHLQTVRFDSTNYWGWWSVTPGRSPNNHLVLGPPLYTEPSSTARPSVSLIRDWNQGGYLNTITYAYEGKNGGIAGGKLVTSSDLSGISSADFRTITTDPTAYQPSVISLNAATSYVYYASGDLLTTKLRQCNYSTLATTDMFLPPNDFHITSIQAAVNPTANAWSVVIGIYNGNQSSYRQTVNYYNNYGYTVPIINGKYWDFQNPSLMIEDSALVNYLPRYTLSMKSSLNSTWYQRKVDGTVVSVGSTYSGSFLRERSKKNDQVMAMVSTATTPAGIVRYPSTGGGLMKSSGVSSVSFSTRSTRVLDGNNSLSFDFGSLPVESLKEREKGDIICAVKLQSNINSTDIAQKVDSIGIPISVEVERNGKNIRSVLASKWVKLSSKEVPALQADDILLFHALGVKSLQRSYEEYQLPDSITLAKEKEAKEENEVRIIPDSYASSSYPNPFNPATTIRIQIPETGHVSLKVYDVLGREVATLIEGMKEAGYYTVSFDGSRLSTGVYFARFVAQPENGSQPFVQVTKMLLTK